MSARTQCPACGGRDVNRLLEFPANLVDYVRCGSCNHVWNVPKGQEGPVKNVTPLPGKGEASKMTTARTGGGHAKGRADLFAYAERALRTSRQLRADAQSLKMESSKLAAQAETAIDGLYRLWAHIATTRKVSPTVNAFLGVNSRHRRQLGAA